VPTTTFCFVFVFKVFWWNGHRKMVEESNHKQGEVCDWNAYTISPQKNMLNFKFLSRYIISHKY